MEHLTVDLRAFNASQAAMSPAARTLKQTPKYGTPCLSRHTTPSGTPMTLTPCSRSLESSPMHSGATTPDLDYIPEVPDLQEPLDLNAVNDHLDLHAVVNELEVMHLGEGRMGRRRNREHHSPLRPLDETIVHAPVLGPGPSVMTHRPLPVHVGMSRSAPVSPRGMRGRSGNMTPAAAALLLDPMTSLSQPATPQPGYLRERQSSDGAATTIVRSNHRMQRASIGHRLVGDSARSRSLSQPRGGGSAFDYGSPEACPSGTNRPSVCKFFLQGYCSKGPDCNWAHILPTKGATGLFGSVGISQSAPSSPVQSPVHHRASSSPRHPLARRWNSSTPTSGSSGMGSWKLSGGSAASARYGTPTGTSGNSRGGYENYRRMADPHGAASYAFQQQQMQQQQDYPPVKGSVCPPGKLIGRVHSLARQQEGCRLLQRCLDQKDPVLFGIIWKECYEHLSTLITDPFGHYLLVRLLDDMGEADRLRVFWKLGEDLVAVSLNVHGTRVVQKMLELMSSAKERRQVVAVLRAFVVTLAKDVYGMHVVLRCLHRMPQPEPGRRVHGEDNWFIYEEIMRNLVSVSTHKHGCCVVQWCIDYATQDQHLHLIECVMHHVMELVQDAYGNYVVQQIMDIAPPPRRRHLIGALLPSVAKLAVQKFASIVVEKCLDMAEPDLRLQLIEQLMHPARLPRLLRDPYANYVIQKVLAVSKHEQFHELISRVRPHLISLQATPFGKRIQSQMVRKFPLLSLGAPEPRVGTIHVDMDLSTFRRFDGRHGHQQHHQQHHRQHHQHQPHMLAPGGMSSRSVSTPGSSSTASPMPATPSSLLAAEDPATQSSRSSSPGHLHSSSSCGGRSSDEDLSRGAGSLSPASQAMGHE